MEGRRREKERDGVDRKEVVSSGSTRAKAHAG